MSKSEPPARARQTKKERRKARAQVKERAIQEAQRAAVPARLKGKRPLFFEFAERVIVIRRLRRAGWRVKAIARKLGISASSVRRGIIAYNRVARVRLALDIERDLQADFELIGDDLARIDSALATAERPVDTASLIRARTEVLKLKHAILRDLLVRRPRPVDPPWDQATLERCRTMTQEQIVEEQRRRMRQIAQDCGAAFYFPDEDEKLKLIEGTKPEGEQNQ
jgi:hypothetical protein